MREQTQNILKEGQLYSLRKVFIRRNCNGGAFLFRVLNRPEADKLPSFVAVDANMVLMFVGRDKEYVSERDGRFLKTYRFLCQDMQLECTVSDIPSSRIFKKAKVPKEEKKTA
jgi:hypothetical protein